MITLSRLTEVLIFIIINVGISPRIITDKTIYFLKNIAYRSVIYLYFNIELYFKYFPKIITIIIIEYIYIYNYRRIVTKKILNKAFFFKK